MTGYKGFYYHFLEMKDGRRARKCELSKVDSAFLLAGMVATPAFFDADSPDEREISETAEALLRRADWQWALYGVPRNANGWPTRTFEDVTIIHGGTRRTASSAIATRDTTNRCSCTCWTSARPPLCHQSPVDFEPKPD